MIALATMGLVGSVAAADFHGLPVRSHADFGGGAFPEPIALAATWDPDSIRAIAALTARDARVAGAPLVRIPLAVARDPRHGRIERTFGEDPFLVAEMGVAAIEGVQGSRNAPTGIVAAVGPFAGPEVPAAGTDVIAAPIAERELRTFYLPPFEAAVTRAGARAVVAGRNEIDGIPAHANGWLLRDVLRGEWKYSGAVLADAGGVDELANVYRVAPDAARAASLAREAGIEEVLGPAVNAARATPAEDARRAALEAAQRAMVLLENRGALPFALPAAGRPGLTLALADLSGAGMRDAIRDRARGRIEIVTLGAGKDADTRAAARADRIVVIAGDDLAAADALVEALASAGKPIVVVLAGTRPGATLAMSKRADAVLAAWALGEARAAAIASVLLGEVSPGGKLPVTIARNPGQWPITYDAKPSARRGYLFDTTEPLYVFGFGLGYTTFEVGAPRLAKATIGATDSVEVSVEVRNTGARAGDETVQVYVRDKVASVTRPVKSLAAFRRVTLAPGESRTLTFTLGPASFAMWDLRMRRVVEPGEMEILAGPDSSRLKPATLIVTGGGA